MPAYFDLANSLPKGTAQFGFLPIGYSALIADWLGIGLENNIRLIQLLALWGTWIYLFFWMRNKKLRVLMQLSQWDLLLIYLSLFLIFINPLFFRGIVRTSDNSFNLGIIALLFCLFLKTDHTRSLQPWLFIGLLMGLFVLIRPNSVSLLPVFALSSNRSLRAFCCLALTTFITYALLSYLLTQSFWFWPSNGPYNFFAGNNPFAFDEIIRNYNAEYSLDSALKWCGQNETRFSTTGPVFLHCAQRFVLEEPLLFVKTTLLKLYNLLLRPNLRLANTPVKAIAQLFLAFPFFVWWGLFLFRSPFRSFLISRRTAVFIFFYSVPFVMTNSDPRFRMPLDIIYGLSFFLFAIRS